MPGVFPDKHKCPFYCASKDSDVVPEVKSAIKDSPFLNHSITDAGWQMFDCFQAQLEKEKETRAEVKQLIDYYVLPPSLDP